MFETIIAKKEVLNENIYINLKEKNYNINWKNL